MRQPAPGHNWLNAAMVAAMLAGHALALALLMLAVETASGLPMPLGGLLIVAALAPFGLVLNGYYALAHESFHRALFTSPAANDLVGVLVSVPLGFSYTLVRRGHLWHHRVNRGRDARYPLERPVRRRAAFAAARRLGWWFLVYGGGFYLVSAGAALLACLLPRATVRTLSPVTRGLSAAEHRRIRLETALNLAAGAAVWSAFGGQALVVTCLLPLLAFALIWSMLQNAFHYDTTVGRPVRWNARNIPVGGWLRLPWLNFNHHLTHHCFPNEPWYRLATLDPDCPAERLARNSRVTGLLQAIGTQAQGPLYGLVAKETEDLGEVYRAEAGS